MNKDKKLIDEIKLHIQNYYKNNNKKIPTIGNIMRKFRMTRKRVKQIYSFLVNTGFLKRNYSQYKKVEEVKKEKPDLVMLIIRIVMLVIGTGAIALSIYYTGIWLVEFLPVFLAYLLSTIMVTFSVVAFEVIIILNGNKQYSILILFSLLWVIVLLFSMTSTVAGQYNQRIENEKTNVIENVNTVNKSIVYDIYEEEEKNIIESIDMKKKELEPFMSILNGFTNIDDIDEKGARTQWVYWDTYEKVKSINKQISDLNNELKKVRENRKEYLIVENEAGAIKETKIEYASFYVWIGDIFGIDAKYIQFWLSVFPAVFVDLIAPLALAVSIFLIKRKNFNEKENKNYNIDKGGNKNENN